MIKIKFCSFEYIKDFIANLVGRSNIVVNCRGLTPDREKNGRNG